MIIPGYKPTTQTIKSEVREAIAQAHADERIVTQKQTPDVIEDVPMHGAESPEDSITNADRKMELLVSDDFPFDESQLAAIAGMIESKYACLTGAAGTGKTTCTKKLVDELINSTAIGKVDMSQYWAKDLQDRMDAYDEDDDYQYSDENRFIPTIVMCSFTGRASQQTKKNFPKSWHGNIMTIHRMLGFVPESYEDWDPEWTDPDTGEKGGYRTKMRFVPTYTASCKLPWDIIIIDEAGMLGLDLWHQLLAACKDGCRIYMIGDINQLPPVHGKSIFGFAMAKWPAFELAKVHRQQGENNPIVDNAWRVIHGQMPQSEGKFQIINLKGDAQFSSRQVRAMAKRLNEMNIYDPIRDCFITPINGEYGSAGFALGQIPLNAEFSFIFNPKSEHPRYVMDGGRERKQFAVGDKVMATRNDWEAGITNGMTGIIERIEDNGAYSGDRLRYGLLDEVNARYKDENTDLEDIKDFSLEELDSSMAAIEEGMKQSKESRERGPSSHIVTVRFGSEEHGFEIPFGTKAEVGSLQTAYVVTCHKMQGGEAPTVVVIVHDSHKRMLYREWLYTAITRASERCIILATESALRIALSKQTIKGRTLREKVESFNALMDASGAFDWNKNVELPVSESRALTILDREDKGVMTPARLTTDAERSGGVATLLKRAQEKIEQEPVRPIQEIHVHVSKVEVKNVHQTAPAPKAEAPPRTVDGGVLKTQQREPDRPASLDRPKGLAIPGLRASDHDRSGGDLVVGESGHQPLGLPAPTARFVSQVGAVRMERRLREANETLLLTHQPRNLADETLTLLDGPTDQAQEILRNQQSMQQAAISTIKAAAGTHMPKGGGLSFLLKKKES